jgi:hypothetical protein
MSFLPAVLVGAVWIAAAIVVGVALGKAAKS